MCSSDLRAEIEQSADGLVGELRRLEAVPAAAGDLSAETLDLAAEDFLRRFDPEHGGFGRAPKFPPSMALSFLLQQHHRTGNPRLLHGVEHTLEKMAHGGMYDQLGGGFHRYSVDEKWLVPHFEKMLYDNALLSRIYLDAFLATGRELYRRIAVETLDYVRREMTDPSGGFYSSQDADSEGEEGKFFVWTPKEIRKVIGGRDVDFNQHYGVTAAGNFEGSNILNVGKRSHLAFDEFDTERRALFAAREGRVKPHRDEKVLTAWNGLMMAAFEIGRAHV